MSLWFLFISDLPKCPKECQCTDGTLFINCSRRALNEIPNELPNDALVIDLSQNNIKQLNITAFANCTSLRDLLVNENQIESITGEEVNTNNRQYSLIKRGKY